MRHMQVLSQSDSLYTLASQSGESRDHQRTETQESVAICIDTLHELSDRRRELFRVVEQAKEAVALGSVQRAAVVVV